jgi:hypothetical protein
VWVAEAGSVIYTTDVALSDPTSSQDIGPHFMPYESADSTSSQEVGPPFHTGMFDSVDGLLRSDHPFHTA